jgi:hypothetical protein
MTAAPRRYAVLQPLPDGSLATAIYLCHSRNLSSF